MRRLQRAAMGSAGPSLTDGQLLERFVAQLDEVAFEALVRRHGPMVFAVCKRICRHQHDAEDAFQACFLVLARKASSIRPADAVGNWLFGVARRTSLRARAMRLRTISRERQVDHMPEPATESVDSTLEIEAILDQELSCLADKYRTPLVLCELEGRTRKEVARQLKLPEGTLSSRLATARKLLAKRLSRRGIAVPSVVLASILAENVASASLPTSLANRTTSAACNFAKGSAEAAPLASRNVLSITNGVMKTMLLAKLSLAVSLFAMVIGMTAGAYTLASSPLQAKIETAVNAGQSRDPTVTSTLAKPQKDKQKAEEPVARPASLRGRFTDAETGKPVAGVTVRVLLDGLPPGQDIVEAKSDADGCYELPLPYGHAFLSGVLAPVGYCVQDSQSQGPFSTSQKHPQLTRNYLLQRGSSWQARVVGMEPKTRKEFQCLMTSVRSDNTSAKFQSTFNTNPDGDGNFSLTLPISFDLHRIQLATVPKFPTGCAIPIGTMLIEGEFDSERIQGGAEKFSEWKDIGLRDAQNHRATIRGAEVELEDGKAILIFRAQPFSNIVDLKLRGIVVDEAGKAISGARLRPIFGSGFQLISNSTFTHTDVTGLFELPFLNVSRDWLDPKKAVWIRLIATGSVYQLVESEKLMLADLHETRIGDFGKIILKQGHGLRGKVIDERGIRSKAPSYHGVAPMPRASSPSSAISRSVLKNSTLRNLVSSRAKPNSSSPSTVRNASP